MRPRAGVCGIPGTAFRQVAALVLMETAGLRVGACFVPEIEAAAPSPVRIA
jgi:hypothetical protein